MNLLDIYKELNTEDKCLAFLEGMRWPSGVKCLSCESSRITRITAKGKTNKKTGKTSPDRKLYQCNDCRFQFTATTGTVYHDTHLPLSKWFLAIALITESRKGISANQLARALGVQYRTAWYLAHRIRKSMVEANPPKLTGTVEIDETHIGGRKRGHKGKMKAKDVVMGIRERGGDLRLFSDRSPSLGSSCGAHQGKRQPRREESYKIYVRGDVHTNTIESAFSLFKRGVTGAFHQISLKHLQRYLNEFSFRFNNRKAADLFGMTVARLAAVGNMPYAKLIEENAFTPFVRP